jgi:F-type H+-transporting ATPase subunit b
LDALGIDPLRLVWQTVNFLILLFLLQRLLFKPILRLMDQRAAKIRESIDEAQRMQKLADEIRQMNEVSVEEAKKQANQIIEGARHMAGQFEVTEKERASKEAELIIQRARDEIALERDRAIAEVRRLAVDLAIEAAGKVIEQKLSRDEHVKLVEDYLSQAQLGAANGQH